MKASKYMKGLLLILTFLGISFSAFAQGTVYFNNKVGTLVDAKVSNSEGLFAGAGVGAGYTAQLALVAPEGSLTLLAPTTTFRTASAGQKFYVFGVTLTIPGTTANQQVTLRMLAWETIAGSYAAAKVGFDYNYGQSNDVVVTLGGAVPGAPDALPGTLTGLSSFSVGPQPIPEPTAYSFLVLGGLAFGLRKRS